MPSPCSAAYREPPACFLIHPPGPPPLSCLHSVSLTAPGAGRASIRSFSLSVPAFLCLALSLSSSVPLPLSLGARDGLVLSSWFSQAAAPYACEVMCVCARESGRTSVCGRVCMCVRPCSPPCYWAGLLVLEKLQRAFTKHTAYTKQKEKKKKQSVTD